ncbi:MAG: ubiquinone/menaquinone biosynthesis methyltransferase, partial [Flavobacteriaceae bacterium]|nr:ubiquinone/menaquinone biosynthesis methyltransferase [Flavobacteriaceae bacterium]
MLKPNQKSESSKKNQVEKMFDSISFEYDLLNGIMTFNNHKRWKKNILNIAKKLKPKNALDIATGTADIAINLGSIPDCKVTGVDISEKMLNVGREKISKMKLSESVSLETGDAENLNFKDNHFDLVTIGFGVRNFQDLQKGLKESFRILNEKGTLIILETSVPENKIMKL